jgi:hypothetical protein
MELLELLVRADLQGLQGYLEILLMFMIQAPQW